MHVRPWLVLEYLFVSSNLQLLEVVLKPEDRYTKISKEKSVMERLFVIKKNTNITVNIKVFFFFRVCDFACCFNNNEGHVHEFDKRNCKKEKMKGASSVT